MNGAATHRVGLYEVTQQRDGMTIDWDVPITLDEGWSCVRLFAGCTTASACQQGHENYPLLPVIPRGMAMRDNI
jgi:hypothetical protein